MGHSQIIYALAALGIASLLNITALRVTNVTKLQLMRNEVLSEVSGVATEILEDIGSRTFDARTDTSEYRYPPKEPHELTPAYKFGASDCDPEKDCLYIDDFHGKTFHRVEGGLPFDVSVEVFYVDDDNPNVASASQTFSKAVCATITSPVAFEGATDKLLEIQTTRVFSFMRTMID